MNSDYDIVRYFNKDEMMCPCCRKDNTKLRLLLMLDSARANAGIAFHINSGCRCNKLNELVGGKINSSHIKGLAVDIKCTNSVERGIILKSLIEVGFKRIGISDTFIHVDIDETKPDCIWLYK